MARGDSSVGRHRYSATWRTVASPRPARCMAHGPYLQVEVNKQLVVLDDSGVREHAGEGRAPGLHLTLGVALAPIDLEWLKAPLAW